MNSNNDTNEQKGFDRWGGMDLQMWMEGIGRKGRATASRWVSQGIVVPYNVNGQNFISTEEIKRFWSRAKAGEFAMEDRGIIQQQRKDVNGAG